MLRLVLKQFFVAAFICSIASYAEARPSIVVERPAILSPAIRRLSDFSLWIDCEPRELPRDIEFRKELIIALSNAGIDVSSRGEYLLKFTVEQYSCGLSGFESKTGYFPMSIVSTSKDVSSAKMLISTELVNRTTSETIVIRDFNAEAPLTNSSFGIWFFNSNITQLRTGLNSLWVSLISEIVQAVGEDLK